MFGYITINKPELKVKDSNQYLAYYCGLCRTLKERYKRIGQLTLTYDMTFLILLLTGLYEKDLKTRVHRCIAHPAHKHQMLYNEVTEYAADMNIVLAYYNLMDDWKDNHNLAKMCTAELLRKSCRKIEKVYDRQCKAISDNIEKLHVCEQNNEENLDIVSGYTGRMLGEIFAYKEDEWSEGLRKMGFYLGKYIYLMDAYEDIEKDKKKYNYNPLLCCFKKNEDIDNECKEILTMMMTACAVEFEKLPVLLNADILRNIIYAGVWTRYDMVLQKRLNKTGENI